MLERIQRDNDISFFISPGNEFTYHAFCCRQSSRVEKKFFPNVNANNPAGAVFCNFYGIHSVAASEVYDCLA